jgi:hypothetical protein
MLMLGRGLGLGMIIWDGWIVCDVEGCDVT